MNLTQLVRCGVAYSLGTRVWEDGRCPMITFHDEGRTQLNSARTIFGIEIVTGYGSGIFIYAALESEDGETFRRTVSISGVYSDIPSTLLPESFWKVIEGRLTKAIRQARRKRQVKRILPNMG